MFMHKIKLEQSIYLENHQREFPYIESCLFTSSISAVVLILKELVYYEK